MIEEIGPTLGGAWSGRGVTAGCLAHSRRSPDYLVRRPDACQQAEQAGVPHSTFDRLAADGSILERVADGV